MAWILIADDDPLIREVWADALSQAGYRTVQTGDGRENGRAPMTLLGLLLWAFFPRD